MVSHPIALAAMISATGKDLPWDSGSYEICKNIPIETPSIETKHFIVDILLALPGTRTKKKPLGDFLPGGLGVCLPAVCHDDDILGLHKWAVDQNGTLALFAKELEITPSTDDSPNPFNNKDDLNAWGGGTTIALLVVGVLVALVLYSTCVVNMSLQRARDRADILNEASGEAALTATPVEEPRLKLPKNLAWCEAFSLNGPSGTWTSLWKIEPKRPTDCLNGFRVLSMLFIIMGHGLLESAHIAGYSNALCIDKNPFCDNAAATNMWAYMLLAGQLGVDTFFYIGGFLLSFIGKNRPVPIVLGTALRYARLLPLFGFIMMLYILVAPYLAWGPFAPRFQHEVYTECNPDKQTWWSELIFINAFYPWKPFNGGCMGWSWYLGVDMVFAIFGMVLLTIWKMNKAVGWGIAIFSFIVCTVVSFQQVYAYNGKMAYEMLDAAKFGVYSINLYNRPYHRLPGFLIGLVAPWALDIADKRGLRRGTEPRTFQAKMVVYLVCFIALVALLFCIFLPWTNAAGAGQSKTALKEGRWTLLDNAGYIGLVRPIWCMCWLVWTLACYFDYLPLMNSIFGHHLNTPLANLTFGAYLSHPIIVKIIAGNMDSYYSYTAAESITRCMAFAMLAYSVAICCWCLVEKPFATLTGWLVPKGKKKPAPKTTQPSTMSGISDPGEPQAAVSLPRINAPGPVATTSATLDNSCGGSAQDNASWKTPTQGASSLT